MIALERGPQRQDLFRAVRQNAQEIVILVDPGAEKLRSRRACVALFAAGPALAGLTLTSGLACRLIICQPSPGQIPGLSCLAMKAAPSQATISS
jgi:hypothetical protein